MLKKFLFKGVIFILFAIASTMAFLFILGYALNLVVKNPENKASWEDVYRPRAERPDAEVDLFKNPEPKVVGGPDGDRQTISGLESFNKQNNIGIETKNIPIDFTSQAPFAVWDTLHEEACEEAALVMAYYWINRLQLTPELAEKEILNLVEWQKNNLGYFENTSASDTAKIAREAYGLEPRILNNPSVEDIKTEISSGNVVVMGMAGKILQNPYFKPPGPAYHMLLLRGFDEKGFFVNDPGTRRGNNFFYTYENLMDAAHDWNGSEDTLLGSLPVALVFSRNN